MTTEPWSPGVEPFKYLGSVGFYVVMMLGVAIVSGISDDLKGGAIVLAIHLAMTVVFTLICFGWLRKQIFGQWVVSTEFPPQDETRAVLEGRIIEAGDGVVSPCTRTPCVAWGIVETSGRQGRNPQHTVWHTRPFLFEDRRGRGRILIEPRRLLGKAGFESAVPDLIVATYINPYSCSAEKKDEIVQGIAEARGEPSPRSWTDCARYEVLVRDGDDVLLRGRFTERERGSGIPGVPAYEFCSEHVELGTREAIVTRHGSHWYGMWDLALVLGSFIATFLLVPLEIIFG